MLQKIVAGMTKTKLETFNSTLWCILPKMKFHGRKRVKIAVAIALLCFEDGKEGRLMDDTGIPLADTSYFEKADKNRAQLMKRGHKEARHNCFPKILLTCGLTY